MPLFSTKKVEWPKFSVLAKKGGFEVRQYDPFVVSEATFFGLRGGKEQDDQGFWVLAAYSGIMSAPKNEKTGAEGNPGPEKLPMTTPVIIQETEGSQAADKPEMKMQFVVPPTYTMETAPTPLDSRVEIKQIPARTVAVSTFSGSWNEADLRPKAEELRVVLEKGGVVATPTKYITGFYNAPFVPHMMRRNEVWLELPAEAEEKLAHVFTHLN